MIAVRAFKAGPAVVDPWEKFIGHDESTYSPEEYGDYLVTSNGIYTCSNIRADALASVRLKAFKTVKGKDQELKDGPVVQLLKKVNGYWTMNRLIKMTELSLCLWGKNYWAVERGASTKGRPREIWWMRPDRVTVYPDPEKYIKGFEYTPVSGGDPIWFDPWEVVWFREPNPLDEYGGLSPIAAARLAADLASGAAKSNKYLFEQGYQHGGVIVPKKGVNFTETQAKELEASIDKRFKGVDKAHRWGVLRFEAEMKSAAVTPKDAEFLGTLEWSLEEIARAYGVPLDMIGGQRTYENVKASDRAFWMRTMMPECEFVSSELVEQLLPMFGKGSQGADLVAFDLKKVPALMDDESETWTREKGQIEVGAITVNEWRETKGLEAVEWGDEWWAPMGKGPVKDGQKTGDERQETEEVDDVVEAGLSGMLRSGNGKNANVEIIKSATHETTCIALQRVIEVGSEEHKKLWARFVRREERYEQQIKREVEVLFERQRESVLQRLEAKGAEEAEKEPFKRAEWVKKFRVAFRELLKVMLPEIGADVEEDLGIEEIPERVVEMDRGNSGNSGSMAGRAPAPWASALQIITRFDVDRPEVIRFMVSSAQRFATFVNDGTWDDLRLVIAEGLGEGEGIEKIQKRVEKTFLKYVTSDPAAPEKLTRLETIARTESVRSVNGGTLLAYKQSEVVNKKTWLAGLDHRTRESHLAAHARYQAEPIGLEEDFEVGGGKGPAPGQIGIAEEDINCRCTIQPVF